MIFSNFAKKHRSVATLFIASIFISVVCLMLVSCVPNDIKYDEAITIAKKDFGCEKILWIQSGALILETKTGEEIPAYSLRSHYAYYVIGEKDGTEIYIVVPSSPNLDKPYTATWGFDYSFAQVVEKFNEYGAQYVADVPNDYYSLERSSYIDLRTGISLNGLAEYYDVGGDDDTFYDRLDVKAVFEYRWEEDGYLHGCVVTQESGELKSYDRVIAI